MARDFPGANSNYLSVGDVSAIDITGTQLCISLWVRPETIAVAGLVSKASWASQTTRQYGLLMLGDGKVHCSLGDNAGRDYFETTNSLIQNAWNHVFMRRTGTGANSLLIWLNGVQETPSGSSSSTSNRTIQNTAHSLIFGNRTDDDQPLDGHLAEIAIWNAAVSDREIAALAAGLNPQRVLRQSLRGYWPLWGEATPERDYSGNGAHAALVGSVPASEFHVPVTTSVFPIPYAIPLKLGGNVDDATVYVDLQSSGIDSKETTTTSTVSMRLTPSGFEGDAVTQTNQDFLRISYFNGASENPLSEDGTWARFDTDGAGSLERVSGTPSYVRSTASGEIRSVYFTGYEIGPDVQVMLQTWSFPAGSQVELYLLGTDEGTGGPEYYRLRGSRAVGGSPTTWTIDYVTNDTVTQLATTNWSWFGGDWIYLKRVGDLLEFREKYYQFPEEDDPDPTEDWVILSVRDTRITNTIGVVGFGANHLAQVRNFFAGSYDPVSEDSETVYLTLTPSTHSEGIPGELVRFTFNDMDLWHFAPEDEVSYTVAQRKSFVISEKYAIEGATALRHDAGYWYPYAESYVRWMAVDENTENDTVYLSYAFRVDDWARLWQGDEDFTDPYIVLPNMQNHPTIWGWDFGHLTVEALSQTTGQIEIFRIGVFSNYTAPLSAGVWHTLKMALHLVNGTHKVWIDGTLVVDDTADFIGLGYDPAVGISVRVANRSNGVIRYDDMRWQVGTDPGTASSTELKTGDTTQQWVKLREQPDTGGGSQALGLEWDPDVLETVSEVYTYAEIYIPRSCIEALTGNDSTFAFYEIGGAGWDAINLWIRRSNTGGGTYYWSYSKSGSGQQDFVPFDFERHTDRWLRIQCHVDCVANTVVLDIDGDRAALTGSNPLSSSVSWFNIYHPGYFDTSPNQADGGRWLGVDNMAYSLSDWVNEDNYDDHWDFEGADPLNDANNNYPGPPARWAGLGIAEWRVSLEEGGYGPGPGLPLGTVYLTLTPSATEVADISFAFEVYLNLSVQAGSIFIDATTVLLDLIVLGGECHSTWSGQNVGDGDAYPRWVGRAYQVWTGDADTRWSPGVVIESETIHC